MNIKSQKTFNIDSRDGEGTGSRFRYKVDLPVQHRFNRVCITKVSIPKSWYAAQDGQNTFTLIEGGSPIQITITPGNYNRASLATELGIRMTQASTAGVTYSVSFPNAIILPDDGKYVFHALDEKKAPVAGVKIKVPGLESNMFEMLGFDPDTTNEFGADGTLKSKNVVKVQPEDVVRIHSNVCDNAGNDILLETYAISTPTFGTIIHHCPEVEVFAKRLSHRTTNVFEFSITNEAGNELNLNGLNWNFELILFEV